MKRLLAKVLTITVASTVDQGRADRSRFVWGQVEDHTYALRVIGVLNGLVPRSWPRLALTLDPADRTTVTITRPPWSAP